MAGIGKLQATSRAIGIVTIRPIADTDHAQILRINAGSRPAVAPLDRAGLARLLAIGGRHFVAVAADGTVVGYLLAFAKTDAYDGEEFLHFAAQVPRPFFYVDQVAIDTSRWRSGIGRLLYEALVQYARSVNVATLCCEVNLSPPNPESLDFHRRLGFAAMGNGDTLDGRRVTFLVTNV